MEDDGVRSGLASFSLGQPRAMRGREGGRVNEVPGMPEPGKPGSRPLSTSRFSDAPAVQPPEPGLVAALSGFTSQVTTMATTAIRQDSLARQGSEKVSALARSEKHRGHFKSLIEQQERDVSMIGADLDARVRLLEKQRLALEATTLSLATKLQPTTPGLSSRNSGDRSGRSDEDIHRLLVDFRGLRTEMQELKAALNRERALAGSERVQAKIKIDNLQSLVQQTVVVAQKFDQVKSGVEAVPSLRSDIEKLKQEIETASSLHSELDKVQQNVGSVETTLEALEIESQARRSAFQKMDEDIQNLAQGMGNSQDPLTSLEARIQALEAKATPPGDSELATEVKKLATDLEYLRREQTTKDDFVAEEIESTQGMTQAVEQELQALVQDFKKFTKATELKLHQSLPLASPQLSVQSPPLPQFTSVASSPLGHPYGVGQNVEQDINKLAIKQEIMWEKYEKHVALLARMGAQITNVTNGLNSLNTKTAEYSRENLVKLAAETVQETIPSALRSHGMLQPTAVELQQLHTFQHNFQSLVGRVDAMDAFRLQTGNHLQNIGRHVSAGAARTTAIESSIQELNKVTPTVEFLSKDFLAKKAAKESESDVSGGTFSDQSQIHQEHGKVALPMTPAVPAQEIQNLLEMQKSFSARLEMVEKIQQQSKLVLDRFTVPTATLLPRPPPMTVPSNAPHVSHDMTDMASNQRALEARQVHETIEKLRVGLNDQIKRVDQLINKDVLKDILNAAFQGTKDDLDKDIRALSARIQNLERSISSVVNIVKPSQDQKTTDVQNGHIDLSPLITSVKSQLEELSARVNSQGSALDQIKNTTENYHTFMTEEFSEIAVEVSKLFKHVGVEEYERPAPPEDGKKPEGGKNAPVEILDDEEEVAEDEGDDPGLHSANNGNGIKSAGLRRRRNVFGDSEEDEPLIMKRRKPSGASAPPK